MERKQKKQEIEIRAERKLYDTDKTVITGKYVQEIIQEEKDNIVRIDIKNKEDNIYKGKIQEGIERELTENVEVIFYDSKDEFAIRLLTNQNDEILLYRTDQNKSFNQYYESLKQKEESYNGDKKLDDRDEVKIPYIDIDTIINYDELCGKFIKGTDSMYIQNALQNVRFFLNEKGGHLLSEAGIKGEYNSALMGNERTFYLDNNFVLFLKEKNKDKPYMALKVDNINILQKVQQQLNL